MKKYIKAVVCCGDCNGTGLYIGFCEHDGAAIICNACDGTGKQKIKFEIFVGRKKRTDVKRVYISGSPYATTCKDEEIVLDNGNTVNYSREGVSYEEWLKGKKPNYITSLGCPLRLCQSECHSKKGFVDICNKKNDGYISNISKCKQYPNFKECWERFYNNIGVKK